MKIRVKKEAQKAMTALGAKGANNGNLFCNGKTFFYICIPLKKGVWRDA